MPARALGLAYADVDPGDLKLDLSLDAPKRRRCRARPFTHHGEARQRASRASKAYVAVAAVDLGILNLDQLPGRRIRTASIFGQRQLGVEFRDLYGQLIDPMQGTAWARCRVGGDERRPRSARRRRPPMLVAPAFGHRRSRCRWHRRR